MPNVRLPSTPPAERYARVIIDTTDGPMLVTARYDPSFVPPGGPPTTTQSGELCTTPCFADLPVGKYRFYLSAAAGTDPSAGDTDDVTLAEPGVYVYRRAPGRYDTPSPTDQIGPAGVIIVSTVAMIFGLTLLGGDDANQAAGGALVIGGIAGNIAGGVWAYEASRAVKQDGRATLFRAE
jgi:hypothetical protein